MPERDGKVVRLRPARRKQRESPVTSRQPAHDREAERAVLGAIIVDNDQIDAVRRIVDVGCFFDERNRLTFAAAMALRDRREPVDLVTLKHELSTTGKLEDVGGLAYLAGLTDGVPRSQNGESYAGIVRNLDDVRSIQYQLDVVGQQLADRPAESDAALDALRALIDARRGSVAAEAISEPITALAARLADTWGRLAFLGDLLALGEIAMLHGQPRDGKTWLALSIAIAVAIGPTVAAFGRFRADRSRAVLVVNNEDGPAPTVARIQSLIAGYGVTDAPENLHVVVGRGVDLDDPTWQAQIIAEAKRLDVALIVLDPLRSLTACVDQGPAELRPFAAFVRRLVRETGAALLLVHHDVKPSAGGPPDTRRRAQKASGGALFSIVDAPIHVERVDERRSLVAADGFKHVADPAPFVVERVECHGGITLVAEGVPAASSAADVALQARIREYLRERPGASGNAIAKDMRGTRKQAVVAALEDMFLAGEVDRADGARGAHLWMLK